MPEEQFERRTGFNAGEISPWLDPRIDQEKYHMGCRQMRNVRPTVYGGAFKRPGTQLIGRALTVDGACRLLSFQYEAGKTFLIELTHLAMRVWTTGPVPTLVIDEDTLLPLVEETPWEASQLNALHYTQLNDLLFVAHPKHAPRIIARYEDNDWRVVRYNPDWPALLPLNDRNITLQCVPANNTPAPWVRLTRYSVGEEVSHEGEDYACRLNKCKKIEPGDHKEWKRWWRRKDPDSTLGIGRKVTLQASKNLFSTGHDGSKWVLIWRRDILKITMFVAGGALGKVTDSIYCLGAWSASTLADNSGSGNWDVEVTVQRSEDNKRWNTYRIVDGGRTEVQSLLTGNESEPCFLRIKLTQRVGTIPTQYKCQLEVSNRDQHGVVRIKEIISPTSAIAILEFPVPNSNTTEYWQEPAWSDKRGFPAAMCLHEGRLWFGGTKYQPTTFWGTAVDRFETFRLFGDELGQEYRVASEEANAIMWMCSHDGLVIGTKGSVWFYGERIGEDVAKLRKSSAFGSSNCQAKVANETIVFLQSSKRKLRELAWDGSRFACQDLTLLAEHFGDAQFVQIAIQKNPETVVWVITDQGDLIGMTYERGQNVTGWFRYETGGSYGTGATFGAFESVCLVEGTGEEDEIYVSTKRIIGNTISRFIERFQPDLIRNIKENDQADLMYSDCAVRHVGIPNDTVYGLEHLEGARVSIIANGAPLPSQVVVGGQVTIPFVASKIIVGLPYYATIEPTYLETSDPGSITKAFKKRLTKVYIEFWESLGCEISVDNGETWEVLEFRNPRDLMDQVPPLWSGIKELSLGAGTKRQSTIILRSAQPLPMNLLSLTMRFVVGTA